MGREKQKFESLEDYIEKIVKNKTTEIKEEDAKKIVSAIMPSIKEIIEVEIKTLCNDIDQMIANKVSEHFHLIGTYVSEKFKLYKGE